MTYLTHKGDAECPGDWCMEWPWNRIECDRCGASHIHTAYTQELASRENMMGVFMRRLAAGTV